MGGSKSPEVPNAPVYQNNPALQPNIDWGSKIGKQFTSLDFSGDLSALSPLIQTDPEVTKLALQYAQQSLTPAWQDTIKQLRNEAAGAGALESSTFTDALTGAGQDLQSQYQAIVAQAALADRERALTNMADLSKFGVNTVGQFTTLAGQQEQMANNFALQNYENQLAQMQLSKKSSPWGTVGAIVGGVGGFMIGGPAGAMIGSSLGGSVGSLAGGDNSGAGTYARSGISGLGTGFGSGLFNPYTGSTTTTPTAAGASAMNAPPLTLTGGLTNQATTVGGRWY